MRPVEKLKREKREKDVDVPWTLFIQVPVNASISLIRIIYQRQLESWAFTIKL